MKLQIYLFIGQCIFFCSQYKFVNSKALIGSNIGIVRQNQYPFVVAIMKMATYDPRPIANFICAGSLISARDVLTSEHCVSDEQPEGIYARIGSVNLNEGAEHYTYWWLTYDQWAVVREIPIETIANDVAVIRLLIPASRSIALSVISTLTNTAHYGLNVVTVGWGTGNDTYANTNLQIISVKVISAHECEQRIMRLHTGLYVDERQALCTVGNPPALLTWGDSGGPLLYGNVIIALNRGTCPEMFPFHPDLVNYHVGVDMYRNFILELKYFNSE